MSFLKRIFNNSKVKEVTDDNKESSTEILINKTIEYISLESYISFIDNLLKKNKYISRKEYLSTHESFNNTFTFFDSLLRADTLTHYASKNSLSIDVIMKFMNNFNCINDIVDNHNEKFINDCLITEKDYLDDILRTVDPNILLDNDQRKVVLTDEDYCLVIAGAGAGKTTTVAAKVKYLVERKGIDPKDILVISFTNKAVGELKEKINRDLKIDCPITTFHSTGHAIIRKQSNDRLNIRDQGYLYHVVMNYFKETILANKSLVNKLVMFFGSYFDAPFEGEDLNNFFTYLVTSDFSTLKSNVNEYSKDIIDRRSKKKTTITNEVLKSRQEVEIANFLFMNGIDYVYEPEYKYHIHLARKMYTPDFCITQGNNECYIEHFGISESGQHNRYTPEELNKYKKAVNDKVLLHRRHKTNLICTFSSYNDGRSLIDHLKEELIKRGFNFNERSNEEIFNKLTSSNDNKYISKLVKLICIFIGNFKTNGFIEDDFYRLIRSEVNVRTKLFLEICKEVYLEYQKRLTEANAVDFEDMINESAKILREVAAMKQKLSFKYIIVDEYQDISRQRFDLTYELSRVCDAKIIAVGDDWQSIYAFSGSDISLFTNFVEKMGYGKELKITSTYRNAQEVIDIAGTFIQKNSSQIKKELISPKRIKDPVIIYSYCDDFKRLEIRGLKGVQEEKAKSVELIIGQIIEFNKQEDKGDKSTILLIGRYGFDGERLGQTSLFTYDEKQKTIKSNKYPQVKLDFMTAHSSKGLGYDNVIIINGVNAVYGFPSKIEVDPVLKLVIKDDKSIDYAEERRLFYVALTRTKNRVFIVAPETHPSEFVMELKEEYKNVIVNGELDDTGIIFNKSKTCPACGYPLQLRQNPAYGLKLYMCTNEPELCNFISNDLRGKKMSIMKCDQCVDGYLVVKSTKNESNYFLGCTNYLPNGTGCSNTLSMLDYYAQNNLGFEIDLKQVNETIVNKPENSNLTLAEKNNIISFEIKVEQPIYDDKNSENNYQAQESTDDGDLEDEISYEIKQILKCVVETTTINRYGQSTIIDILRGVSNRKIIDNGLASLSSYNTLKDWKEDVLKNIFENLINEGYLVKTNGLYPVVDVTWKGLALLDESKNINQTIEKKLKKKINIDEKFYKEVTINVKSHYITSICRDIERSFAIDGKNIEVSIKKVQTWLVEEGYLEDYLDENRINTFRPTEKGKLLGISQVEKYSKVKKYVRNSYNDKAIKFILSHIDYFFKVGYIEAFEYLD